MTTLRDRIAYFLTPKSVRQAREDAIGARIIGVTPGELAAAGGHLTPVLGSRPFRFRIAPLPTSVIARIDSIFVAATASGQGWLIAKASAEEGVHIYRYVTGVEKEEVALSSSAGIILDYRRSSDHEPLTWVLNGLTEATDAQIHAFATACGANVISIDRERGEAVVMEAPDAA